MARLFLLVASLPHLAAGRSWTEIQLLHNTSLPDVAGMAYLNEAEQAFLDKSKSGSTYAPAVTPILEERLPTTSAPSPSPSAIPSVAPTSVPSSSPSLSPSSFPSVAPSAFPSLAPTSAPTKMPIQYPPADEPRNPEEGYFNYDENSEYGPKNWGYVGKPRKFYWDEFDSDGSGAWKGLLVEREPSKNLCEAGNRQSPIDVRENGAVCIEFHEVRSHRGDFQVGGDYVKRLIESNKLRLRFERRACANYLGNERCREPDPPHADFPTGWGGIGDVIHIDFKIPSEHTIWGKRFDAEMQIYHIHPENRLVAATAVVIEARSNGYNYYLQEALNAFQKEYDHNQANCGRRILEERQFLSNLHEAAGVNSTIVDYNAWVDFSTDFDRPVAEKERDRALEITHWDPHHAMLVPSIHFWRYDGSLTEPPCGEFLTWWVVDEPMRISYDQLEQMKRILFTNVDRKCRKTSVLHDYSVVRPIQNTNNRPVYKCTPDDFGPDQ